MKQLKDPKKIFYIIAIIVIIAGIAVVALKGFNVEIRYKSNQKIELVIGEELKKDDLAKIQEKSDEVFGKGKSIVQIVESYKDTVHITAEKITEEQKNNLVEKVNELYPQEATEEGEEETTEPENLLDASEITIEETGKARLRDVLMPYAIPLTVVTLVILVYYSIMYRKLGVLKVLLKAILTIAVAQALLLSILAITRFPMGRFTTPLMLLVYVTSLIITSGNLMKDKKLKV